MDWNYFLLVFFVFSILLIIAQRISERHQRLFRIFIIILAGCWFWWRFQVFAKEMLFALLASLTVSFVFWLLIGRYNPVGNRDDEGIKVYGLDD